MLRLKQPETFQGRFDVGQVQVSYKLFHWTIGHVSVVFAVTMTVFAEAVLCSCFRYLTILSASINYSDFQSVTELQMLQ